VLRVGLARGRDAAGGGEVLAIPGFEGTQELNHVFKKRGVSLQGGRRGGCSDLFNCFPTQYELNSACA
jgi:hypothetical protein